MPSVFRHCCIYVRPTLLESYWECLPFWLQPINVFGWSASNETSTKVHICSSYHSILAPDCMTFAVPIPLTVPLIRVHCSHRFIPSPFRMVGRILEVELQVAPLKLIMFNEWCKWTFTLRIKSAYNIYLCNFMSQLTPAAAFISVVTQERRK